MLQWHPRLIGIITTLALVGAAVAAGWTAYPGKQFGW
jgi:hypothetical protein